MHQSPPACRDLGDRLRRGDYHLPDPVPDPTLEQLFRRFLDDGDEHALALWMRRSAPPLRRLARRLGASDDDADDLVQETFVAAIDGADRFDATRPLLPWLKGILTFRAAHLARAELRRRRHHAAHGPAAGDAASAADATMARELHADVQRALDDLPPHYREPLVHYLLQQRSPVEIAGQLGVARATVRTHLHRGLSRLRDALRGWMAPLLTLGLGTLGLGTPDRGASGLGRRAAAASPRSAGRAWPVVLASAAVAFAVLCSLAPRSLPVAPIDTAAAPPIATTTDAGAPSTPTTATNARADALPTPTAPGLFVAVIDEHGDPLSHVGVTLEPTAGRDAVLHRRVAVTDADGLVQFAAPTPGRCTVRLDRGPEHDFDLAADASLRQTFRLRGGATRRGVVVDAEGSPVAGATIWLAEHDSESLRGQDVTTSAADGNFELRALRTSARLAARHPRLGRSDVVVAGPTEVPLQLRLRGPGRRVRVRTVDARHRPITAAVVHVGDDHEAHPLALAQGAAPLHAPAFVGHTDADGTFTSGALEAGPCPVAVRHPGHAPYRTIVDGHPGMDTELVVVLQPGARATGVVVADDGATPLAHAHVAFRSEHVAIDVTADACGAFCFEALPSTPGELVVTAAGHQPLRQRLDLTAAVEHQLRLALPTANRWTGRLLVAGRPAPGGSLVRAAWPPTALLPEPLVTTVEADGSVAFTCANDAPPRLDVRLAGELLWRRVPCTWHERHAELRVPAEVVADAWLSGHVRGDDGSAIASARLFVTNGTDRWTEVGSTDESGAYRIGPVPAGDYRLFAETTRRTSPTVCSKTITIERGAACVHDLTAAPTGWLDVRFVADDGAPAGDVLATVQRRDLARRFAIADTDHFRQRLEAGDYVLSVMGRRVEWIDELPVRVDAGADRTLTVTLRRAAECHLAVHGLPPCEHARTLLLHDLVRADRAPNVFTLLPGAPARLGAVLVPGHYALECDHAGQRLRGTFEVVAGDGARAIPVTLLPSAGRPGRSR
jgi:RNA polymerase sigma factor (sigma-70 family)